MKNNFVPALQNDPEIESIIPRVTLKAKTNNEGNGEAEVEYIVDIAMKKDGHLHEIILTCYTTACRIQIQKKGKHEKFAHLGGKYVPRYFMEYYIVPFASKILECNPHLDDQFIPHLAEEMQRLSKINPTGKAGKTKKTSGQATCVNPGCKHHYTVNMLGSFAHCVLIKIPQLV